VKSNSKAFTVAKKSISLNLRVFTHVDFKQKLTTEMKKKWKQDLAKASEQYF